MKLIIFFTLLNLSFKNDLYNFKKFPILYTNSKDYLNIEHIYPKSFLHKNHTKELHNIYASCPKYNQLRSNYKFDDFVDKSLCADHKNKLFIPRNKDKGIIARSILFMMYKYNYSMYNVIKSETLLLNWFIKYKPTKKEVIHNIYAKNKQGYDNPLITNYSYFVKYLCKKINISHFE